MVWLSQNWQAVMSVFAMFLSVIVGVLHLANKNSVANDLQALEDIVNKISGKSS